MTGKRIIICLIAVLLLCLQFAACTETETPSKETTTESLTHPHTETPPEASADDRTNETADTHEPTDDSAEARTETPTEEFTEAPTEVPTDDSSETTSIPLTETPTEPETQAPLPEIRLTIGGVDISEFTVVRSTDMPVGQLTVLNLFVEQMNTVFDVTLPVITDDQSASHEIIIGATNRENAAVAKALTGIKSDGYAIVADGGDLYISATTGRGVVYGMGDFLEKYMGVRLYTTAFICHRPVEAITLDEGFTDVFNPEFQARRTWIDGLYADPLENVLFIRNNSDGLKKAKVGDTYPIRANSNHTIDNLAKVDGKGQVPCLTDEAVYQTVLKSVVKKLDDNLEQNVIQVGQGDGGHPCKCQRCAAVHAEYGTDNATWFLFLNRLADEVAALYPERGVKLITYSYQYTHGVPGNGYTVSDNVIIDFCFDKACYNHAFNDPNCPKNLPVAAELKEWAALCKANNLYVYEYAYNCGDKTLPDPNLFVMWENFQFYLECGVKGILSEGITAKGGEFDYLRAYLRSRLVWNPHMTEEEYYTLMDEFMDDYYGDAAPFMMEYLKIICDGERISCTDMYTPMYTFYRMGDETGETDVSQELLAQCQALFDKALAVETLTETQREHIEYTSIHLLIVRYNYFPKGDRTAKKELMDRISELREKYGV